MTESLWMQVAYIILLIVMTVLLYRSEADEKHKELHRKARKISLVILPILIIREIWLVIEAI